MSDLVQKLVEGLLIWTQLGNLKNASHFLYCQGAIDTLHSQMLCSKPWFSNFSTRQISKRAGFFSGHCLFSRILKGHSLDPSTQCNSNKETVEEESPPTIEPGCCGSIAGEKVEVLQGEGTEENDVRLPTHGLETTLKSSKCRSGRKRTLCAWHSRSQSIHSG